MENISTTELTTTEISNVELQPKETKKISVKAAVAIGAAATVVTGTIAHWIGRIMGYRKATNEMEAKYNEYMAMRGEQDPDE